MRQSKQIVLIETEQWALEHGRQCEIITGAKQRIGQRHKVHDRDVLREHQPVRTCDCDMRVLQRADNGLEKRPALTH